MGKTNNTSPKTTETISCMLSDERDMINASNGIVLTVIEEEVSLLINIARRSKLIIAFDFTE